MRKLSNRRKRKLLSHCTEPPRIRSHASVDRLETRRLLAAATINFNTTYQTMDGFGVQPGIGQDPNPPDSAMQLAFSQTNGIGLEFIRGSMSANGTNQIVGMTQRAAAYGVQLVESPRGPAVAWLNDFGNATNGELNPAHYQDYANLVADYVQNSAAQGIPVYSISMAVEPDLVTTITPQWTGQEFANLLPHFVSAFQARGLTTKIMVNEDVGWETADRNQILADPALSQYVSIVADHAYGEAFNPYQVFSNNMGKQVWMTEYIPQVSTDTQLQNAILTATDIHNAIAVGGASAYLNCFLNFGAQGLMSSWTSPNLCLYAMGNFSKFVRPGWVRVGETDDGGVSLTTFKDPVSGKFAIVSINSGSTNISETYTLNGLSASGVIPYTTSATSNLSAGSAIAVSGGAFSATIAANSIVTYTGISSSAATLQAPVALYAGTMASAQTSQIALSWTDNSTTDTAYMIERSSDGNNWTVLTTTLPAGTTTYVDTGLNEASTYYYKVQATNGSNASPFSAVATGSTILAAPSNITSSGISGGRNLSWLINSGVSTGVTIQRSTDGMIWNTIATLNSRASSYSDTIAGYNSNQIYWYRIRNTDGSQVSAYGAYNTTVNTPGNFTATLASPTSVTLKWTNSSLGAYAAYIKQNGTAITPPNLAVNADTFTATGLTENTSYSFTVQALGPEAWFRPSAQITYGAWSASASASITTPVAAPSGLTAVSTVSGTALLNWVDNSAVETAYDVERSTNGTSWTVLNSALAFNTSTYTDSSAPTGTVFYRVKAIDSAVSSAYVQTQMVSAVPMITTNANVTGTTSNLSASPPSGFGSGALTYTWSLDGTPPGSVSFSANGTTAAASSVATFTAAGSYIFRVTIGDSSGNTTSATSSVTVKQTTTTITLQDKAAQASYGGPQASTPSIAASTWEQLVFSAYDQFGVLLTSQPSGTWSVLSGGGSISSGGLYSAPVSAATPVVRAAVGSVTGQLSLNVVSTPQVVADYSFNETTGYTVNDNIGVGEPGYISGGAALSPGRVGNAVSFDGSSGSVWLGNPTALDIRGQITMSAWIDPSSTAGTQTIISRGYGVYPNWGGTFLRIAGGQYQLGYYDSSFHYAAFTMPAGDVGNWVFLVGTYDGKNWNLYRNGSLVASYATSVGSIYSNDAWRIGSTDVPADYFNGKIDNVRLYGQALSANQITGGYTQGLTLTSAAAANPGTTTNYSTTLSAAAVDPDSNSDSLLSYTWICSSMPTGATPPTFSINGTSAARTTVASFATPGLYEFTVTIADSSGVMSSLSSSVYVVVQGSGSQAPTVANPAAASSSIAGTTAAVSVLGADDGGESNLTYLWTGTGPSAVTWVQNGTNAAKNTTAVFSSAGSYTLTARIIDGDGLSITSSVNVTVISTLTAIAVSPGNPVVNEGATQQLSASALDQFGNTISSTFTWSIGSGPGAVSTSGLYTAPTGQGGLVALRATSGSVTGTAVITVPQDNTDTSGVTFTGTWTSSTTVGGYWGTSYSFTNSYPGTAMYSVTAPVTGLYAVYARWTSSSNRNPAVPIDITSGGNTSTVTVNQQNSGGAWNLLGSYNFSSGASASLTIRAPSSVATTGSVIADGVMFELVSAAPTVAVAAASNPSVTTGSSAVLSVLGADNAGESALTYTWSAAGVPTGATGPVFSVNGTNSAKNTVASFSAIGTYALTVTITDAAGLSTTSTVNLNVTTVQGTIGNDVIRLVRSGSNLVVYTNGSSYSLPYSGLGAITVAGGAGTDSINVDFSGGATPVPAAGLTITGSGGSDTLIVTGSASADTAGIDGSSITLNGSTFFYDHIQSIVINGNGGSDALTQSAQPGNAATLSFNATTIGGPSASDSLNVSGGSFIFPATATSFGIQTLSLKSLFISSTGSVILSTAQAATDRWVLMLGALTFNGASARLDLGGNDLIVHNTGSLTPAQSLLNITAELQAGFNAPSGTWNGPGIASSAAHDSTAHLTALGVMPGTTNGSFDLQSISSSDVLVKYSYFGDSNLSGNVDGSDYSRIDNGYLTQATGWFNGDFNYDGVINGSDYTLIDNAFNIQGASLADLIAGQTVVSPAKDRNQISTAPPNIFASSSPISFDDAAEQPIDELLRRHVNRGSRASFKTELGLG